MAEEDQVAKLKAELEESERKRKELEERIQQLEQQNAKAAEEESVPVKKEDAVEGEDEEPTVLADGNTGSKKRKQPPTSSASDISNTKWDQKWDEKFAELVEFQKIQGHCNPSRDDVNYKSLVIWVQDQRTMHKNLRHGKPSSLTPERIQRLLSIGFQWNVAKTLPLSWEKRYQQLVEYKEKHGHCNVPQKATPGAPVGLGNWVLEQRRSYKTTTDQDSTHPSKTKKLSTEQIEKLEKIGFQWQLRNRGGNKNKEPPTTPATVTAAAAAAAAAAEVAEAEAAAEPNAGESTATETTTAAAEIKVESPVLTEAI
jgi:hypothetical protein